MASTNDWIKMRASLCTNPRVLTLAEIVGNSEAVAKRVLLTYASRLSDVVTSEVLRDIVLGALLRVWHATNDHTKDGVWANCSLQMLDIVAQLPGFGAALETVGWAIADPQARTVTLPNFMENNSPARRRAAAAAAPGAGGEGADTRSAAAKRQAAYRERERLRKLSQEGEGGIASGVTSARVTHHDDASQGAPSNVTGDDNSDATPPARAREEERRGDQIPLSPASAHTPTPAGEVCRELKKLGFASVVPTHPELLELLKAGAELQEFLDAAPSAVKKNYSFPYLLSVVKGRRSDAAGLAATLHNGPLPKPGAGGAPFNRQAALEERNSRIAADWAASGGGA